MNIENKIILGLAQSDNNYGLFNKNRNIFFNRFYNVFKKSAYFYFPKVEPESKPSWFAIPIILKKTVHLIEMLFLNI